MTRLQVLENKNTTVEVKALVLHEMVCKAIHRRVEECPSACEKCLKAIMDCLEEEVGDDFES